jgi:DNA polymerase V
MKAAISDYVQEISEKLRLQNSVCKSLGVFLRTGALHNKQHSVKYHSVYLELPYASNDNLTLQNIAFIGLEKIFVKGSNYKKAGVFVNDLFNADNLEYSLWDDVNTISKLRKLYKKIDYINSSVGTIQFGIQKFDQALHDMRQKHKSPEYTTRVEDIPTINIDKNSN